MKTVYANILAETKIDGNDVYKVSDLENNVFYVAVDHVVWKQGNVIEYKR